MTLLIIISLNCNHFQFASLGILAEFISKIGTNGRKMLTSITMPIWREDDLTEGHMQTVAMSLKDCANLRHVKIMARCSRIGCPVATEDPDAQEHSGDRLIYDLPAVRELRKLKPPPKVDLSVDGCILYTHGKTGRSKMQMTEPKN